MNDPGFRLKKARLDLGLTFRDVERASDAIASAQHSAEYFLPISRLADIENHAALPTIYRIYALCAIYHLSYTETLLWYAVDISQLPTPAAGPVAVPRQTRLLAPAELLAEGDPWVWPRSAVQEEENKLKNASGSGVPAKLCYARIGSEERIMDPLIPPGSLVQIDTTLHRVLEWAWRHEFERPVYLVEHADGFTCSWCSLHHRTLILQPHPLSACSSKTYRFPQQAEVRGQVTGVAMSLRSSNSPTRLAAGPPESAGR